MVEETTKLSPKNLMSLFIKIGLNREHHDSTDVFEVEEFNLTPLQLDVGFFIPFFFPKKNMAMITYISDETLREFLIPARQYVKTHQRMFGVLVVNCKVRKVDSTVKEFAAAGIALLTKKEWEEILIEKDPKIMYDKLGLLLKNYLGTEFLSPYVPGRPARGGRFFSRSNIVKELSIGKNHFTLVGIRRIGKTSLLTEIGDRLKHEQGYRIIEVYGGKCNLIEDVLYELYVELDLKSQSKEIDFARKIYLSSNAVNDFHRHITNEIKRESQPIAFLIDEFDHLIDIDERKNHLLIHIFRELSRHENCRFYFAGFRKTKKRPMMANILFTISDKSGNLNRLPEMKLTT